MERGRPNSKHSPNSIREGMEPFHKWGIRALPTQTTHKTTAVFLFHVGIDLDWVGVMRSELVAGIGFNLVVVAW